MPGVGELCGGSQREERLEVLEARMDELGMGKEDYQWYLDLRRFGSAKHAGYGLGFERLLMYVTGIPNIGTCCPSPAPQADSDLAIQRHGKGGAPMAQESKVEKAGLSADRAGYGGEDHQRPV